MGRLIGLGMTLWALIATSGGEALLARPEPAAGVTRRMGHETPGPRPATSSEQADHASHDLRPTLIVWTSRRCLACCRFWSDYAADSRFRNALWSAFSLKVIDVDADPMRARSRGIDVLPTFEMGPRRLSGYAGSLRLWRALASCLAAQPLSPSVPAAAGDADAPVGKADHADGPVDRDDDTVGVRVDAPAEVPADAPGGGPTMPMSIGPSAIPGELSAAAHPRPPAGAPSSAPVNHDLLGRGRVPPGDSESASGGPPGRTSFVRRLGALVLGTAPVMFTMLELAGVVGGTAVTGGLGTLALSLLWRRLRRGRGLLRRSPPADATQPGRGGPAGESRLPFPRRLDEARELLELRQTEGRVAALDALRGMFLDDELQKLTDSDSSRDADFARRLRAAIDARVADVAPLSTTIDS